MKIKITAISDTHNDHPECSGGDILLHAGDITHGREKDLPALAKWVSEMKNKYKHVLLTPGNHDIIFETDLDKCKSALQTPILINEIVEVEGLKILMSPYSKMFGSWSFMKDESNLANMIACTWDVDVDIAVMHGPPYELKDWISPSHGNVGSFAFRSWLDKAIDFGRIKVLICGHIHESFGVGMYRGVMIVNAAQAGSFLVSNLPDAEPVNLEWDTESKTISRVD